MDPVTTPRLLLAASLGLLLSSCSAVHYSAPGPTGAKDLSRYVLVIEAASDGQVKHSWEPISGFDLSKYPYRPGNNVIGGHIVRAAWTRDCDEEFES